MIAQLFHNFHGWLNGKPKGFLQVALILTSLIGILIAIFGTPELIALVLLYWWLP